jgi:CBS domain-containing protein
MIVSAILSGKGGNVVTIEPTATLADASRLLAQHRIGAVLVTGAGQRIVGIVSERDIVRALAAHGASALNLPLTDVMTRKVVTCTRSDTIAELMEQMTGGKFRHLPVIEDDRLVGIISIGDVVKMRLMEMEHEQNAMRDYIQTA